LGVRGGDWSTKSREIINEAIVIAWKGMKMMATTTIPSYEAKTGDICRHRNIHRWTREIEKEGRRGEGRRREWGEG
jgi:hypothetical protein